MMVTGEVDHQIFGPCLLQFECSHLPVANIGAGPAPGRTSQLGPGRDRNSSHGSQPGVSFSNVMEQRRPDQVLALGVRGGDIPGTGESVAKIGDGLTEERDYLGGSQAGLRLSLFVEGQRSGADEVDQPPC